VDDLDQCVYCHVRLMNQKLIEENHILRKKIGCLMEENARLRESTLGVTEMQDVLHSSPENLPNYDDTPDIIDL